MDGNLSWLIVASVAAALWLIVLRDWQHFRSVRRPSVAATRQRLLKPRTPDDGPACRRHTALPPATPAPPPAPRPWSELQSRRGAPRRIPTAGFACPNHACPYYGIIDADVHARVGDGTHGQRERIQTFRCQACNTTFSARRDTPLYRLRTPSTRVAEVLTAMAEGLSIAAAVRVFGHSEGTISTWLTRAGEHSAALHNRWVRHLQLSHLQLDELRTRLRDRAHVLWLWVAIDPLTKLIPVLHIGARTQTAAHAVVHELHQRLAPSCLPVFTSDGLNLYFDALTVHFGQWVAAASQRTQQWHVMPSLIYGHVKKTYRRRKVVRVTRMMRCGTLAGLRGALRGLGRSGRLNTACVERVNLTIRQSIA
ncbi:MAG: hypothetical protein LC769_12260, partial [Chloroflexi bacterium]|nr:hypothetical protein [Chloroflexota bacterium]